ncbi:hypothetical protein [Neobacillus sp. Marseille-QA0830]
MNKNIKSVLVYIGLIAALMVLFAIGYVVSIVCFYLFIGIIMLPIVVVLTPIAILALWYFVLKPVKSIILKLLLLIMPYPIYYHLLMYLDKEVSWSGESTLKMYVDYFKELF